MKKKLFAILVSVVALLAFSAVAFADEPEYKTGLILEFSGHTDFDYFYTYTAGTKQVNYKCFSVVENGQRKYVSVKESLYESYRNVFANQDVTFQGIVLNVAGDGSPIISVTTKIVNDEKGKKTVLVDDCVVPLMFKKDSDPDLKLLYDLFDDNLGVSVATDGSYLSIDTNPFNIKGGSIFYKDLGLHRVQMTNTALGLPDWLYEEMCNTRALDGKQKETFEKVTVTWTYAPSQGLEVIYRKN